MIDLDQIDDEYFKAQQERIDQEVLGSDQEHFPESESYNSKHNKGVDAGEGEKLSDHELSQMRIILGSEQLIRDQQHHQQSIRSSEVILKNQQENSEEQLRNNEMGLFE